MYSSGLREYVLVVASEQHDLGVEDDVQREDECAHCGVANLGITKMMLKLCDVL